MYAQGFYLVGDLVPLYRMSNDLTKYRDLSKQARQRIKWFDYYRESNNVSKTCRHFDISRKTFYKWKKIFDPNDLWSLGDRSKAPKNKRQREITQEQEQRIVKLRKKYLRYSKFKLAKIYENTFHQKLSSWKIQKVIEKHKLYYHPVKTARITRKRLKSAKKKRITQLKKKPKKGFLLCLDTVELRMNQAKRYIFTAIDNFTKVAFKLYPIVKTEK
ncbi:MAG: helix-turn-helix domain-containing protein [Patescibacteria group bacterium]